MIFFSSQKVQHSAATIQPCDLNSLIVLPTLPQLPWGCSNVGAPVFIISAYGCRLVWCLNHQNMILSSTVPHLTYKQKAYSPKPNETQDRFYISSTSDISVSSVWACFTQFPLLWFISQSDKKSYITKKVLTVTLTIRLSAILNIRLSFTGTHTEIIPGIKDLKN